MASGVLAWEKVPEMGANDCIGVVTYPVLTNMTALAATVDCGFKPSRVMVVMQRELFADFWVTTDVWELIRNFGTLITGQYNNGTTVCDATCSFVKSLAVSTVGEFIEWLPNALAGEDGGQGFIYSVGNHNGTMRHRILFHAFR